ncbi:ferritin-like domain-containing protein [Nitrospira sp. MA-1]|nr:ferritin-like domain-containing protein [Nitrospira sp. MA-1]
MKKNGIVKETIGLAEVKMRWARERKGLGNGPMTAGFNIPANRVVKLLNRALATEIVCVLRYKRHNFMAAGISSFSSKAEFLHHAVQEQAHADQLAERIVQLGGKPNLSPDGFLNRSYPEYVEGESLREMIAKDLIAKRIAINSYRELVASVGAHDPTTSHILEGILAQEKEHAGDRASLLKILGPEPMPHRPIR